MPDQSMNGGSPPPGKSQAKRAVLVLAGAYLLFFITPLGVAGAVPRLCPWYRFTGLDCPFCGLIRSLIATAHGSFRVAVALHPLGPAVFAAGLVMLAGAIGCWIRGRSFDLFRVIPGGRLTALVLALAWLAWWLIRIVY